MDVLKIINGYQKLLKNTSVKKLHNVEMHIIMCQLWYFFVNILRIKAPLCCMLPVSHDGFRCIAV